MRMDIGAVRATESADRMLDASDIRSALSMLEAPDLGNEDGVMVSKQGSGKPTTRRYSSEEKAAAVRMVRTLRAELGTEHGTVQRVAS